VVAPSAGTCMGGVCGWADAGVRPDGRWFDTQTVGATPVVAPLAVWVALVVGRTQGSAPTEVMQRAMVQIA
jgi:hypothetical protein